MSQIKNGPTPETTSLAARGEDVGEELFVSTVKSSSWEEKVAKAAIPVMVHFTAPWCQPCLDVAPIIKRLAVEFRGRVRFVLLDVDDSPEIADKYVVEEIPRVILFRSGKMYEQVTGSDNFEARCRNLIARNSGEESMMNGPRIGKQGRHYPGEPERLRWIALLKARGLKAAQADPTTYLIEGTLVNIKVRHMSPGKKEYWFSVSDGQLEKCDLFVWICDNPDNFIAIPKRDMLEMTKTGSQFNIGRDLSYLRTKDSVFDVKKFQVSFDSLFGAGNGE